MNRIEVIVTGQYGGNDAGDAARVLITQLKQKIRHPDVAACDRDLQVRFNLFVSGEITQFKGPSGYTGAKLQLAKGYVTCDLIMQPDVWQSGAAAIKEFFKGALATAFEDLAEKLKKKGVLFDCEAVNAFIAQAV